ncbi:tumor necrosis factor receptor superfamily member 1A [Polypterus senegalus]|uniref:tumor necrosis factor receptor superfamily member 1A n=1 Tax=Polypterus senegalus TaxID=55291 RepID=UPI0019642618|nr:tumor necrosis factor receptor superfamily member 1A [Polypterus senegalus]
MRNWTCSLLFTLLLTFGFSNSIPRSNLNAEELTGERNVAVPIPPNQTNDCKSDEFRSGEYCCNKCPQGYKLIRACKNHNERSECEMCENGTFLALINFNKNCFRCKECNSGLRQIEISKCRYNQDRVCGCQTGYFKRPMGDTFKCLECSHCGNNSNVVKPCFDNIDTVCKCQDNYFKGDNDKNCKHCSECGDHHDSSCKSACPALVTKSNSDKNDLWQNLCIAALSVLGLCLIAFSAWKVFKHIKPRSVTVYDNVCPTEPTISQGTTFPIQLPIGKGIQETATPECVSAVQSRSPTAQLPDCIPQCTDSPFFYYSIIKVVPVNCWKEFIRRLGLSDHEIEVIQRDHPYCFRDAQYEMMRRWRMKNGPVMPGMLTVTLTDMELAGCAEELYSKLKWQA